MAFRSSMGLLRSRLINNLNGKAITYTTSSTPKPMSYTPTVDEFHHHGHNTNKKLPPLRGDFVPVYVALGMITLSMSFGLYTAWHQLAHAPDVRVRKKLRETVPEVVDPDRVVNEAEKFVSKSFFRRLAHIQDFQSGRQYLPDPIRKDVFAHPPRCAETLKDVGIDVKLE